MLITPGLRYVLEAETFVELLVNWFKDCIFILLDCQHAS